MESAAAASRRVRRRWVAAAAAWGEGGGVGCLGRRQRGPQRLGLLREDRGRREMKFLVLRLLKENNSSCISSSSDSCAETLHILSDCLESLLAKFQQASANDFAEQSSAIKEPVFRQIALEADNLLWLAKMLADMHAADEYATMWASQRE
jgi:hypothetical protein